MLRRISLPLSLALGLALAGPACKPTKRGPVRHPISRTPINDRFDRFDPSTWQRAHGWANGDPFNNGWHKYQIYFQGGIMELALSNSGCPRMCSGKPYLSGELRSKKYYKYGLLEGRIKAAKGSGIVTSLFFYTGTSGKSDHHEIDLEFLGRDTRKMQATYFVKGKMAHKKLIDLKFDASQDFHTYGIRWGKTSIQWLVDGKTVHSVVGSPASLPHRPARIIMNLWPGIDRPDIRDWLGRFSYNGPISAYYDWVRFTPQ